MLIISLIFRVGVGIVLLISGLSKLFSVVETTNDLKKFNFLPIKYLGFIALLIPIVEIVLSIFLIIKGNELIILTGCMAVFLCFMYTHISAMISNDNTNCSCFGKLIKSRHGFGGVLQANLLLISLIPSIIYKSNNLNFFFETNGQLEICIVIFISLLWGTNMILIRRVLDEF
ncbi:MULTISPECIES: MauE/DoxX family redox-associated membrane protein [Paenibacillus]|uniref:MauE/DoxX family redox-associated membrane protein n=1 Tax=Paenibacillus TaxID=44249 RepID=UPI0004969332|nr:MULTISPECIES: MauE/DoxX family redox-associated membrane protein [Paenibacillus]UMY54736.1 DoxX family membrane protein [Paenibacillus peoriae]